MDDISLLLGVHTPPRRIHAQSFQCQIECIVSHPTNFESMHEVSVITIQNKFPLLDRKRTSMIKISMMRSGS